MFTVSPNAPALYLRLTAANLGLWARIGVQAPL